MTPAKYRSPTRRHLERHLPHALLATACVTVLPVAITAVLVPSGDLVSVIASIAAAVGLSVLFAAVGKALWTRRPVPRELVFSDLMIWSWLNRVWIERRLRRASREVVSEQLPSAAEHIAALGRLERLLEARDVYTHGHSQRVTRHVEAIARAMHLGHDDITKILTAAAVHDVGKVYTPREVLNKPGKLTDGELQIIQRHPVDGVALLGEIEDPEIRAMVRHHHERLDGGGYPDGLRGDAIPLGARIIAVADTFDAMTSSRAYRPAGIHREALEVLRREAGRQLDPDAVAAFSSYYAALRPVAGTTLAVSAFQRIYAALGPTPAQLGGWTASLGAITLLTLGAHAPGGLVGHQRGDAPRVAAQVTVAPIVGAATAAPVVLPTPTRPAMPSPGASRHHHHAAAHHHAGRPGGSGTSGTSGSGATPGAGGSGGSGSSGSGGSGGPGSPTPPASSASSGGGGGSSSGGGGGASPGSGSGSNPVSTVTSPLTSVIHTVTNASTPPVTTPSVSTPSVNTPSVSTPAVATPPVSAGPIHVPSVTVPSATVPSVTVPSVTVPSITVPSVTVPKLPIPLP